MPDKNCPDGNKTWQASVSRSIFAIDHLTATISIAVNTREPLQSTSTLDGNTSYTHDADHSFDSVNVCKNESDTDDEYFFEHRAVSQSPGRCFVSGKSAVWYCCTSFPSYCKTLKLICQVIATTARSPLKLSRSAIAIMRDAPLVGSKDRRSLLGNHPTELVADDHNAYWSPSRVVDYMCSRTIRWCAFIYP